VIVGRPLLVVAGVSLVLSGIPTNRFEVMKRTDRP
jgi:hypothetical protein